MKMTTISISFSGKTKEITMQQAYAVFWIDANGRPGNGEYILDEATLRAWLGRLRGRYPDMLHWGQLPNGERYIELPPIDTVYTLVG